MQVKKFEAKTMKEALDLVKVHMGPEAIILSAKDNSRGFGLIGHTSVEVTAAVSEETLRRKKIAETKLRDELKKKFHQIPASQQKQFINKVFADREEELVAQVAQSRANAPLRSEEIQQLKGMRYIDITDDASAPVAPRKEVAQQRVRTAAQRARDASMDILRPVVPSMPAPERKMTLVTPEVASNQAQHIHALESQLGELRSIIQQFQKIPQTPTSLHPGAELGVPFDLCPIYTRLVQQGVQTEVILNLTKRAQKEMDLESLRKPALVDAWVVQQLLNSIEVVKNPTNSRYHIFVGCTGQGKTSTLVKLASHLVLKEKKKIAIVSMDTIKVGAADQLRTYAQILNVPFAVVKSANDWKVAEQKLANVQHVLVDCPGLSLNNYQEVEWLRSMLPPTHLSRSIHYVQSVLARDEETMNVASRYNMVGFHDVIFTRLDESSNHGLILNFQNKFKVPLHSFGMGSRVPEDYEWATKERVVDLIFKLSKVSRREGSHE